MNSLTFKSVLHAEVLPYGIASRLMACIVFVIVTAAGAYVRVPLFFTPVPLTLQTFFVLLSGAVLGRKLGALSQMLYISLGVLGLPIFQGYGCGIAHIFGPTGGYLFGFICASYAVGYFIEKHSNIFLSMLAGVALVYTCGIVWLKLLLGLNVKMALMMGLYPFLPGEIIKVVAASCIFLGIRNRMEA